ncbi:MAG: type II toxin-antitoxin system RelE/ParE family toxin [Nevskia sp.]|nr:type II toxin-antitoxin system RelE/ParE family toxin [Nevskia sp.]
MDWLVLFGSSYKDLSALPDDVQDTFGYALDLAQRGLKHDHAKPFTQAGGGVMEVVEDDDGKTYRAMYTAKLPNAVYVLHCFQKKSKSGKATPREDVALIEQRLKAAEAHSKQVISKAVPRKS